MLVRHGGVKWCGPGEAICSGSAGRQKSKCRLVQVIGRQRTQQKKCSNGSGEVLRRQKGSGGRGRVAVAGALYKGIASI